MEGTFKNVDNQTIRLALVDIDDIVLLDSIKIKDGHFKFVIKAESETEKTRFSSPMLYQLMLNPENMLTTMAQKGDHLIFEADGKNLIRTYHVRGGEEAILMAQLDSALSAFIQPTEQLYLYYQENINNDSIREQIEHEYMQRLTTHKTFLSSFIENHPHNMASYIAFYQSYNRRSFFSEEEDFAILKSLTYSLNETYPNNPYIKNMVQHVEVLNLVQQPEK